MNPYILLLGARADLYGITLLPECQESSFQYLRHNRLDVSTFDGAIGGYGVLPVRECGNGRFDFAHDGMGPLCFVCEAIGRDGETVTDLVAWPVDDPFHVMTMFGACALVGEWEADNPATYFMESPLVMHRTPLDWLKAGCRGAAVVTPHRAARFLLDVPGRIAAQDYEHGRDLNSLIAGLFPAERDLIPATSQRRAA